MGHRAVRGQRARYGPNMIRASDDPATLLSAVITAGEVSVLRHAVAAAAASAGLAGEKLEDFVLAVNELTTNAVRHGGGSGHLLLRCHGDRLTCQMTDQGPA